MKRRRKEGEGREYREREGKARRGRERGGEKGESVLKVCILPNVQNARMRLQIGGKQ